MADTELPQMHCPACRSDRVVRQGSLCGDAHARCLRCWGRSTIEEAIGTENFPYLDQPAGKQRFEASECCQPVVPQIPNEKVWTMRELAEALSVPRERVRKWHRTVGLTFHEPVAASRNMMWVSHWEFIEFVQRKPWLFRKIDANRLLQVVANKELMKLVRESKDMRKEVECH